MASKVVVNLDTSKENYLVTKCKQNDDLILEANIYENGIKKNLTNCSIVIQAKKSDNTYVIQNTDITKLDNSFTANLVRDITRVPGKTLIEVVLAESSKQNTTFSFTIDVVGSVIKGAIESSNTVTILEALENKIVETEQLITSGGAATKGELNDIKDEVEEARGSSQFLVDRLDFIEGDIQTVNASLEEINQQKASKSESRLKETPIYEQDLAPTLKQIITGITPLSAIPLPESVTPEMTQFLLKSRNLFNKENVTVGKAVNYETGQLLDNANYNASEYIYIEKLSNLYNAPGTQHYAFYKKDFTFISGVTTSSNSLITKPTEAYWIRISIAKSVLETAMLVGGTLAPTEYIPYSTVLKDKYLPNIPSEKIVGKVSNKNVEAIELGKNRFNKNTIVDGYYVTSDTGVLLPNASYCVSDYIDVSESDYWTRSDCYRLAWYDENKVFISGINDNNKTIQKPLNAKLIRLSVVKSKLDTFQFEKGQVSTEYENYGYYLADKVNIKLKDNFELLLPNEIKVAKGRTIEIYNKHICFCLNINNYAFEWKANVGKAMKRKFVFEATTNGTYPITLNVYNSNFNIVASKTFNIVVSDINTATKNIMCIGDSLSSDKLYYSELLRLNPSITFIGTQGKQIAGVKHEGRSGYTSRGYVIDSSYGYIGNYKIKPTNLSVEPTSKKKYRLNLNGGVTGDFEVEQVVVENGVKWIYFNRLNGGGDVITNSTATAIDTGVIGDNSIAYTEAICTSKNPFWNPNTSQVDFNYYNTSTGISKPSILQIYLGTNDLDLTGNETAINIKTLIDACNRDWNIPINVVLPIYYGNQDGQGKSSGASRMEFKYQKLIFEKHKAIIGILQGYTNVRIVPIGMCHDSEYNFGMVQEPINCRHIQTMVYPIEATHPQDVGYLQHADVMLGYM